MSVCCKAHCEKSLRIILSNIKNAGINYYISLIVCHFLNGECLKIWYCCQVRLTIFLPNPIACLRKLLYLDLYTVWPEYSFRMVNTLNRRMWYEWAVAIRQPERRLGAGWGAASAWAACTTSAAAGCMFHCHSLYPCLVCVYVCCQPK